MSHLRALELRAPPAGAPRFPFTVPSLAALIGGRLEFTTPVTIFVGENGSGKSTLLEALALAIGSITVGSRQAGADDSLDGVRPLADRLRLIWNQKTRRGFFMRSEDFFGYARQTQAMRAEFEDEMRRIDADDSLPPLAKGLAKLPYGREAGALGRSYGAGLDTVSHGESFLRLFQARLVPNGVYLLDEPEAPLSPLRQLALVALIKDAIAHQGAQFILATHSPILMAAPQATILSFGNGAPTPIAYDDVEHVRILRDFLAGPERFLRHL